MTGQRGRRASLQKTGWLRMKGKEQPGKDEREIPSEPQSRLVYRPEDRRSMEAQTQRRSGHLKTGAKEKMRQQLLR